MRVEAAGADEKARAFARVQDDLDDVSELVEEVARRVQRDARSLAPKRTGRLASSIGIRRVTRGHVVKTSLTYAQFVHYGSIHNPRPVRFLEVAARRADPRAGQVAERQVDRAIARAGL